MCWKGVLNTYLLYIFTKKAVIFSLCNLGLSPSEQQALNTRSRVAKALQWRLTASDFHNYLASFARNITQLHSLERCFDFE